MFFLSRSVQAMEPYVNAGLTTFDMADIYGPAEEIFGSFYSQVWHCCSIQVIKTVCENRWQWYVISYGSLCPVILACFKTLFLRLNQDYQYRLQDQTTSFWKKKKTKRSQIIIGSHASMGFGFEQVAVWVCHWYPYHIGTCTHNLTHIFTSFNVLQL